MAKLEVPAHIEIAALKEKQVQDVDLMASGPGTPWEDRGSHGAVSAFFKTAGIATFKPAALFQLIRRPNSAQDANLFLMISGGMWSLALIVDAAVMIARGRVADMAMFLFVRGVLACAAPFILLGLLTVATNVYTKIVEGELKRGTPRTLAQNIFGYAAGPSLLAPLLFPVHWAGGLVVVFWMLMVAIVGARSRMRLSMAGGAIGVVLGMAVAGGIATAAYFGVDWLYRLITL